MFNIPRKPASETLRLLHPALVRLKGIDHPWRGRARRAGEALLFALLAIGAVGYTTHGKCSDTLTPLVKDGISNERTTRHGGFYVGARNCADMFTPLITNTWCAKKEGDPVVAVIGDSHAGQLFLGIRDSSDETLNKVIFMGVGSCYPTVGFDSREGCGKQLDLAFKIVEKTKSIKYVIIAGYYGWSNQVHDAAGAALVLNGYRKTISHFLSSGKRVVFVIDNPALGFDSDACLAQKRPIEKVLNLFRTKEALCSGEYTSNLADQSRYRTYISELFASYPNVLFYDPRKKLCPDGPCRIIKDGMLLYSDTNHLSQYGSSYLTEDLFMQMKNKW